MISIGFIVEIAANRNLLQEYRRCRRVTVPGPQRIILMPILVGVPPQASAGSMLKGTGAESQSALRSTVDGRDTLPYSILPKLKFSHLASCHSSPSPSLSPSSQAPPTLSISTIIVRCFAPRLALIQFNHSYSYSWRAGFFDTYAF